MVLTFRPDIIFEQWLGVSPETNFLGDRCDKEANSLRKSIERIKAGKQKRLNPETEKKLRKRIDKKLPDPTLLSKLDILNDQRLPPWEATVSAFNEASGNFPLVTLEAEAIRLERLAVPIKAAVSRSDFRAAYDLIEKADMPLFHCLPRIISQIDYQSSQDRLTQTAIPLAVATTLYLLACAEADGAVDGEEIVGKLLPEMKNGEVIRPMRRWLENAQEAMGLRTKVSLAKTLLPPPNKLSTSTALLRKWRSGQEMPSWARVRTMVDGVEQKTGGNKAEIEAKIKIQLCIVRILDGLMVQSILVQNLILSDYDPWGPFRDYPLMLAHARSVKAGLSA